MLDAGLKDAVAAAVPPGIRRRAARQPVPRRRRRRRGRAGAPRARGRASAISTPRRITATGFRKPASAGRLRGIARDDYLLSTKVGRTPRAGPRRAARAERLRRRAAVSAALGLFARRHAALDRRQPAAARRFARSTSSTSTTSIAIRTARPTRSASSEVLAARLPALRACATAGAIGGFGLGVNDWRVCVDVLRARRSRRHAAGRPLHAARPERAARAAAAVRAARRRDRHRRPVQLRHPRDRRAPGRRHRCRISTTRRRRRDRVARVAAIEARLRRVRRAAACRGAAVSARASGRRQRAGRRAHDRRVRPESRACAHARCRAAFWQALRDRGLVAPDAPLPRGSTRDAESTRTTTSGGSRAATMAG